MTDLMKNGTARAVPFFVNFIKSFSARVFRDDAEHAAENSVLSRFALFINAKVKIAFDFFSISCYNTGV